MLLLLFLSLFYSLGLAEWDELCPRGDGFADTREMVEIMDGSIIVEGEIIGKPP